MFGMRRVIYKISYSEDGQIGVSYFSNEYQADCFIETIKIWLNKYPSKEIIEINER